MPPATKNTGASVRLTPTGSLRIDGSLAAWQQRLFELGARPPAKMEPSAIFGQQLALDAISSLCHATLPEGASAKLESMFAAELPLPNAPFLDSAPPMPGGEYLNQEMLEKVWKSLLGWCARQIRENDGLKPFLDIYVPDWKQVGRVFFHLGENRLDNEHPFAFLATYVTGTGAKGRLRHTPLGEAVQRYANNRSAMMNLLEPVQRAACKCGWIRAMCDSGALFVPTPWEPEQAYQMLHSAEELEACGIGVRLPDWWKKRPRLQIVTEISADKTAVLGAGALLDFDMAVAMGDETLDDAELERILAADASGLVLVKNQWVEADSAKLKEALAHWQKVKKAADSGYMTFQQGMRLLAGVDDFGKDAETEEEIDKWSRLVAGPGFRDVLKDARELADINKIPGLCGELRPYQQKGVAWLRFLNNLGLGACLADDMGLGKTIQILSLLLLEQDPAKMPTLLVAPASLMANWKTECQRFAPSLRLLLLHPSQCGPELLDKPDPEKLREHDLIVTSYTMAARLQWLREIEWSRIVADEAQNIKNSQTRQSIAVRALRAPARIALTGTPIENSVSDLWALFDFINPGLLGTARQFGELLKNLRKNKTGLAPLRRLTAPYILRRMKSDKTVITSLPDKTEVTLYCNLVKEQAVLYQRIVNEMQKKLQDLGGAPEDKGKRNLLILQSLILLKQICNHPAQAGFAGEKGYDPKRSGKFQRVGELCAELAERQERALIFTQFREIIEPLGNYLTEIFGAPGLALHGQTPVKKRGELVNQFQDENGPPFFILSLKAGGSGLNLTAASHVIHFDRWWNPAVENQATDRAYRIGQKRNVLVHKCLASGTLEEKIDQMLQGKKALADEMLSGLESNIAAMSDQQIMELVRLDAKSIME